MIIVTWRVLYQVSAKVICANLDVFLGGLFLVLFLRDERPIVDKLVSPANWADVTEIIHRGRWAYSKQGHGGVTFDARHNPRRMHI